LENLINRERKIGRKKLQHIEGAGIAKLDRKIERKKLHPIEGDAIAKLYLHLKN
jgi:hypothetical protein